MSELRSSIPSVFRIPWLIDLVVKLLQETVQPGLRHLHGPGLIGYVAHFDQNHHQLHAQH